MKTPQTKTKHKTKVSKNSLWEKRENNWTFEDDQMTKSTTCIKCIKKRRFKNVQVYITSFIVLVELNYQSEKDRNIVQIKKTQLSSIVQQRYTRSGFHKKTDIEL